MRERVMTTSRIDLDQIARQLGIKPEQVTAHLTEAIDAGLLRVVANDGVDVVLEATTPHTTKEPSQ